MRPISSHFPYGVESGKAVSLDHSVLTVEGKMRRRSAWIVSRGGASGVMAGPFRDSTDSVMDV